MQANAWHEKVETTVYIAGPLPSCHQRPCNHCHVSFFERLSLHSACSHHYLKGYWRKRLWAPMVGVSRGYRYCSRAPLRRMGPTPTVVAAWAKLERE